MMPVEWNRDRKTRWLIFLSIAQYALHPDLLNLVMDSDPNERDAFSTKVEVSLFIVVIIMIIMTFVIIVI